jgi:hypothetical protein
MYGPSFFQDIGGELKQRCTDAEHTRENVYVEAGVINRSQEQHSPLLDKTEIFAETEVGDRIIDQEKAEKRYRQPEKGHHEHLFGPSQCQQPGVHTMV